MVVAELQKFSLIDFPGKISAVLFTRGCNFRCPYCHNPELLRESCSGKIICELLSFLEKRKNQLQGVVITGGEPTIHPDLPDLVRAVKSMGFAVKLDTNGSRPGVITRLISDGTLDFIALDIKAPLEKYKEVTRTDVDIDAIRESIRIVMNSNIPFRFRTTVAQPFLNLDDLEDIHSLISPHPLHLQQCRLGKVLDDKSLSENQYTAEQIHEIQRNLNSHN